MADMTDAEFNQLMDAAIAEADAAFNARYSAEIQVLTGISRDEIDAITPGNTTDLETYERLMAVVREASRKNVSQAQLLGRIQAMGEVAVEIAKKVPSWAMLLP